MTTLLVIYPSAAYARFDRDYYVNTHLPMVREAWEEFGFSKATPMFAAFGDRAFEAMVLLEFPDRASIKAALAAPATGAVVADGTNFTDLSPVMQIFEPG